MQNRKAVIIGSGVAGLAAATRLSVQGFSVSVYEKNSGPGGKLSAFTKEGFCFDAGPSVFIQPENLKELFDLAGEPMEEYFSYRPVPVACKYFYENGTEVTAGTNAELFAAELEQKTGEPASRTRKYLSRSEKLYKNIGTIFLNHSLHKRRTWFNRNIFKALGTVRFPYLFKTMDAYHRQFRTPEARQLFNRFATYNGSSPFKAPAMLSLIPHPEHNEGVFYPGGGMISITNALHRLALKKGVLFHFNSPVQSIICPENKAIGIVVNNKNIPADIVVSNGDIYFTYTNLLGHSPKAKKIFQRERSSSALVFYWGIKGSFPQLELHNIFFSENYAAEFDHIFKTKKIYNDPTVYINITSKEEPGKAPAGCENWFVMINMPANTEYDASEMIAAAKRNIIGKLNRILKTDIETLIIAEETLHPQLIQENTGSYKGSLYGTASNSKMAAFLRHPNFTSYIKNLYFCGGTVHPGGGIPLCLKSAMIMSDIIKRDFLKQKNAHV